ncbi:helix-hairpin-helix domain-containing protein [Scytonema sp. PRP1]|uniref:helix-hairpin-helix domain-containing protein n=1 Tax=Scytonema sp. PRP1 TaxID=3120513 RepID=UPI00300CCD3F
MMRLQDAISRTTVELYEEIANSGEGRIFRTSRNGYLAKIYHSVDQEKINKLWVMMKHPPIDPAASRGHTSIAWPNALLEDDHGRCLGFLMPLIQDGQTLINVYNPEMRKKNAAGFNWLYLHTTALNIATVLQALHAYNYVVGDLKPENLLVNAKGLVSIIDTDSFQIIDPNTGKVYRSPVASPEYTPHEMFGKDFQVVDRSEVQDRFGLAVIIWLLLFGYHPFSGKWVGIGDQSNPDERIRNGHWMYGSTAMIRPGPSSMPLNILHPTLQLYFRQCFDNGHSNPNSRPSAAAWVKALSSAKENLRNCSFEQEHYYSQNYGKCYWCERKQLLNNYDIFPSTQSYRSSTPRVPSSTVNSPTPTPSRSFVNNKTRGQSLNKISLNKIKLSKAKGNGFLKALSVIAQFSGNYILPLAFNLLRSILKLSVWLVRRHLLVTLSFLTILIISISCWHDQVRQAQLRLNLKLNLT